MLTSTDVSGKMFRVALRGYSEDEVDVFLDRIAKTLWEREAGRRGELTPRDIDQQTFMVALRGYAEEEVTSSSTRSFKRCEITRTGRSKSLPHRSPSLLLPRRVLDLQRCNRRLPCLSRPNRPNLLRRSLR